MNTKPDGEWRLLAAALLSWALCAWALPAPGRGVGIAIAASVIGLTILGGYALTRRKRAPRWRAISRTALTIIVLPCAALLLIGAQLHRGETARGDPALQDAALNGTEVSFEAELAGFQEVKRSAFGERSWVRVAALTPRGGVPILVWLSDIDVPKYSLAPGVHATITARLKAQSPESAAAYTATPTAFIIDSTPTFAFQLGQTAATLRQTHVRLAATMPGTELLPGFAVGDTSLVSEDLNQAMLESSLSHLTAVSGGNTGLVIATLVWTVARLGGGLRLRTFSAFLGLVLFVLIVGPDASVQRAAVMAGVLLLGSFGGNTRAALPALGFAIIVLLAVNPWQAVQAGFALSVVATGGILLFAPALTKWLNYHARLPTPLALAIAVALSAQLACGPFLLLLQPGVPAIGVIANVLAAPAAPVATGVGLLSVLLAPLSVPAATACLYLASFPARWIAAVATVSSDLPGGRWFWPGGWPGALLFAGCEAALVLAWALGSGRLSLPRGVRVPSRVPWAAKTPAPLLLRLTVALLVSLGLGVFTSFTLATPIAQKLGTPQDWIVVACDVGQGDALLVRTLTEKDQVVLVDTGKDLDALQECLETFGVNHIALLVLTHDDLDHVGAYAALLDSVDRALISGSILGQTAAERRVIQGLESAGVPYRMVQADDRRSPDEHGPDWLALSPVSDRIPATTNAASIAMLFDLNGASFLALADTGKEEQTSMLSDGRVPRGLVDIVKVAHHGSRNQDPALYQAVAAVWGLVSVGAHNGYGHPAEETLGFLADAGTRTLRTDLHGSIAIVQHPDGSLEPWLTHASDEQQSAPKNVSAGQ